MSFWDYSVSLLGLRELCLLAFLLLRYCALARLPTWRLPVPGCVVDLVTAGVGAVREVVADGSLG